MKKERLLKFIVFFIVTGGIVSFFVTLRNINFYVYLKKGNYFSYYANLYLANLDYAFSLLLAILVVVAFGVSLLIRRDALKARLVGVLFATGALLIALLCEFPSSRKSMRIGLFKSGFTYMFPRSMSFNEILTFVPELLPDFIKDSKIRKLIIRQTFFSNRQETIPYVYAALRMDDVTNDRIWNLKQPDGTGIMYAMIRNEAFPEYLPEKVKPYLEKYIIKPHNTFALGVLSYDAVKRKLNSGFMQKVLRQKNNAKEVDDLISIAEIHPGLIKTEYVTKLLKKWIAFWSKGIVDTSYSLNQVFKAREKLMKIGGRVAVGNTVSFNVKLSQKLTFPVKKRKLQESIRKTFTYLFATCGYQVDRGSDVVIEATIQTRTFPGVRVYKKTKYYKDVYRQRSRSLSYGYPGSVKERVEVKSMKAQIVNLKAPVFIFTILYKRKKVVLSAPPCFTYKKTAKKNRLPVLDALRAQQDYYRFPGVKNLLLDQWRWGYRY